MSMSHVHKAFELFDLNGDGFLSLSEFKLALTFLNATNHIQNQTLDSVKEAFRTFDLDENGFISCKEYIDGSRRHGSELSDDQLKEAFKLFDLDRNGIIDYKEFYCAMNYLSAIKKK